jgi:hypothetical protein
VSPSGAESDTRGDTPRPPRSAAQTLSGVQVVLAEASRDVLRSVAGEDPHDELAAAADGSSGREGT